MKYGKLSIIGKSDKRKGRVLCVCDCGILVHCYKYNLTSGASKSCGCLHLELVTKHGKINTPTYRSWRDMKRRCYNRRSKMYKYYGARGITVCERWHKFENFLADMGEMPKGLTLERVDNSKGYSKANCVWASRTIQVANRRPKKRDLPEGVYQKFNKYVARIMIDRKVKVLGRFDSAKEAGRVYQQAKKDKFAPLLLSVGEALDMGG